MLYAGMPRQLITLSSHPHSPEIQLQLLLWIQQLMVCFFDDYSTPFATHEIEFLGRSVVKVQSGACRHVSDRSPKELCLCDAFL